jgi:hypothetical protein
MSDFPLYSLKWVRTLAKAVINTPFAPSNGIVSSLALLRLLSGRRV